jgi:hypothetical protein
MKNPAPTATSSARPGLRAGALAEHAGLDAHAPVRPIADRAEYWGLKLFVGLLFVGSSLISLTGLFLVVRWVRNL